MKTLFRFWILVLFFAASHGASLWAEDLDSPFDPHLQYSADVVTLTNLGERIQMQELYSDNGKVRLEMTDGGKTTARVIRPDLQKFYFLVVNQKIAVEVPYNPDEFKNQVFAVTGAHGKYQLVGPEVMEEVKCLKYKGTAGPDKKGYFAWVDAATKAPVKIIAVDGSFGMVWKNFKAGPQDAALFEVPADFKAVDPSPKPGGSAGSGK